MRKKSLFLLFLFLFFSVQVATAGIIEESAAVYLKQREIIDFLAQKARFKGKTITISEFLSFLREKDDFLEQKKPWEIFNIYVKIYTSIIAKAVREAKAATKMRRKYVAQKIIQRNKFFEFLLLEGIRAANILYCYYSYFPKEEKYIKIADKILEHANRMFTLLLKISRLKGSDIKPIELISYVALFGIIPNKLDTYLKKRINIILDANREYRYLKYNDLNDSNDSKEIFPKNINNFRELYSNPKAKKYFNSIISKYKKWIKITAASVRKFILFEISLSKKIYRISDVKTKKDILTKLIPKFMARLIKYTFFNFHHKVVCYYNNIKNNLIRNKRFVVMIEKDKKLRFIIKKWEMGEEIKKKINIDNILDWIEWNAASIYSDVKSFKITNKTKIKIISFMITLNALDDWAKNNKWDLIRLDAEIYRIARNFQG
ncbi:MAG: hypothetical protein Q9M37_06580 [Desulfonauticus sp.]|nr:hypothetical protein [Desulfonauticus sp.]